MVLHLLCRGGLSALEKETDKKADVVAVYGNALGEISYEKELLGQTSIMESTARLSRRFATVIVAGATTNTLERKYHSAIVAENGKILGVSDSVNQIDGKGNVGAYSRVYEAKIGRIGVVVGTDLYFPDLFRALCLCGSDVIVCVYGEVRGNIESVLARAYAFLYGVPIVVCGDGYAFVASPTGEIVFATAENADVEILPEKEFHLIEYRKKGFVKKGKEY